MVTQQELKLVSTKIDFLGFWVISQMKNHLLSYPRVVPYILLCLVILRPHLSPPAAPKMVSSPAEQAVAASQLVFTMVAGLLAGSACSRLMVLLL